MRTLTLLSRTQSSTRKKLSKKLAQALRRTSLPLRLQRKAQSPRMAPLRWHTTSQGRFSTTSLVNQRRGLKTTVRSPVDASGAERSNGETLRRLAKEASTVAIETTVDVVVDAGPEVRDAASAAVDVEVLGLSSSLLLLASRNHLIPGTRRFHPTLRCYLASGLPYHIPGNIMSNATSISVGVSP